MNKENTNKIKSKKRKLKQNKDDNNKVKKKLKVENAEKVDETNEDNNELKHEPMEENAPYVNEEVNTETDKTIYEEEKIRFPKDFNTLTFREKLRGNEFIPELRHFLHLSQKNEKFIAKYFEKRGKPLELVEAIERIDKKNVFHVSYICEAFEMILMKILTEKKEHSQNAINASRYFLKSHGDTIELLLKSQIISHRKIILKLLTAIVCLEPELGRQILNCFDFLSNTAMINTLLSHSKSTAKNESETVRKVFIHYILSYLVDGNIVLIRNILEKGNLFKVVISGLLYDDHVTVCVVLNTIKQYIVENSDVLKTKKVHLFDLDCIRDLTKLYGWLGPKLYGVQAQKKDGKAVIIEQSEEDLSYKSAVRESVHELLVVLLTSRKYGLAFDSTKDFKQKHNLIQRKTVLLLKYAFADELKKDLVIKILKSCPDTAKKIVKYYGTLMNPEKTGKKYWPEFTNFVSDVITALNPSIFGKALLKMTLTDLTFLIKNLCLSAEVLVHLKDQRTLLSNELSSRVASTKLLLACFKQFCNYMFVILDNEKYKGNDMRRFKMDLINYIMVNFPTIENVLLSCFKTTENMDFEDNSHIEHLDVVLDLVLLVAKHNRPFFNQSGLVIDFMQILDPLFSSEELGTKNLKLELKAIKTILLLKPYILSPDDKLFEKVLNCFVNIFVSGEKEMQREAGDVLRGIFLNTPFFSQSNILEVDLWLQTLKFVDNSNIELITFMLFACFQVQPKDIEEELEDAVEERNKIDKKVLKFQNFDNLFSRIESNLTVEGYVDALKLSDLLPYICLKIEKGDKISEFLELISLLLFHYLPNPEDFYAIYSNYLENHKVYMEKVLKKNKVEKMPVIDSIPYYNEIHKAILNGETKFFEIFDDNNVEVSILSFMESGKKHNINEILENERLIFIYIYLIIFITIHLTENSRFEQNHVKSSHQFLKFLLKCLHQLETQDDIVFKDPIFGETATLIETNFSYLKAILKYIFCQHVELIENFDIFEENESKQNFLKFLCDVTDSMYELIPEDFEQYLFNFQEKITKQIDVEINVTIKDRSKPKCNQVIKILETFRLSTTQCTTILKYISKLNYKDFIDENGQQNKSIYLEILIFCLNRIAELRQCVCERELCEKIALIYSNLISNMEQNEINLEKFEDSLHNFLIVSHQSVEFFSIELFKQFFDYKKLTKSAIKLGSLLIERNSEFKKIFLENIKENLTKKELVYPFLNVVIKQNENYKFDEKLLKEIYQEFKNGFMKTIEKPQKSGVIYKENVEVSMYLMKELMPLNECVDFAKKLIKTDAVEIYQLKLINSIYIKAIESLESNSDDFKNIFINFLNNAIQLYNIILKRDQFDELKTSYINYIIYNWTHKYFNKMKKKENTINFDKITKSQHWTNFYKSCLKNGIQISEELNVDKKNSTYLKILAYICSILFNKDDSENEEIVQIYQTILTHAKFSDIVLNEMHSPVKTQIFNLLLVLAKINHQVLDEKHIPIFLGSYQARLTNCDRYILALIQFYEINGINLHSYRPFLWGKTAISHYSLSKVENATLEQREASTDQVMFLFDRFISESTVENYPVWRKLNALNQLPEETFENPDNLLTNFGANVIEKYIEYENFYKIKPQFEIDNSVLKLSLKKDKVHDDCYDPAFIIPLMCMCFAAEINSQPVRPVQNGLLGIVFAAMSSQDKEMRLAAGCCQLRYRQHIESRKFFDKDLWLQAYDNIQNGLNHLQDVWIKTKKKGIPRVPYISGIFLARGINVLIHPTNPVYKTIVMYLRLKETFNFLCVPEFNVLFHSSETNHTIFQHFILDIIKDGLKSSSDLLILISNNIFKAIMGFYFSVMTNLELNLKILSILSTCAKIPSSSKLLIDFVGILPWLNGVIEQLEYYKFDTIEGVISIISNLWYSMKIREDDFYNFKYIESYIFKLLVKLCPNITARISLNNFARYMNILEKTAGKNHKVLKEQNINRLILCAQKHCETEVWQINNIKSNGSAGVESKESFLRRLIDNNVNESGQLALYNLREYVIEWSKN